MGQNMCSLSEVKSPTTCDRPTGTWTASRSPLPANSRGHSRPSSAFTGYDIRTFLPSSTATLDGQKPFQWLMLLPPHVLAPLCHTTLLSLECLPTSRLTGGLSSPQICGQPYGHCWEHSYTAPRPTTRRQMASLSAFVDS